MTTRCNDTVHTPECDRWRAGNSAVFFFDVIVVVALFAALVANAVSKRRNVRPAILSAVSVGLAVLATVADVFARSL